MTTGHILANAELMAVPGVREAVTLPGPTPVTVFVGDDRASARTDAAPGQSHRAVALTSLPYAPSGALDLHALRSIVEADASWQARMESFPSEFEAAAAFADAHRPASLLDGGPLVRPEDTPDDLVAVLERAALTAPGQRLIFVKPDGTTESQSYEELLARARRICGGLLATGLPRATPLVLQLQDAAGVLAAFWGAILAGWRPVPQGVPAVYSTSNQPGSKLVSILGNLPTAPVVTEASNEEGLAAFCRNAVGRPVSVLVLENLLAADPGSRDDRVDPNEVAVILQTSGSTSAPKMVPQTHARLINRTVATIAFNGFGRDEITLNTFPLDHVCGLIMFHLRDVFLACTQIHAKVDAFLRNPIGFLDLCDRHGVTATWAPNFAFNLINSRRKDMGDRSVDLSALRFIENCAESVVASQNLDFVTSLGRFGVKRDAIKPAWGMSETCSVITLSHEFSPAIVSHRTRFVRCGRPYPGCRVRVVGDDGQIVRQGTVGNLQVTGATVFEGYLDNPKANAESFTADGWFDTGDLAVILDGELAIVGRAKDSIIINGNNIGGHEIEECVDALEGVEPSCTAAVAVRGDGDATDRIALFFHTKCEGDDRTRLCQEIRRSVTRRFGATPDFLIPVQPSDVPKTSVGKIQKERLRAAFHSGALRAAELGKGTKALATRARLEDVCEYRWTRRDLPFEGRVSSRPGAGTVLILSPGMSDSQLAAVTRGSPWDRVIATRPNDLPRDLDAAGRIEAVVIVPTSPSPSRAFAAPFHLNGNGNGNGNGDLADAALERLDVLRSLVSALAAQPSARGRPIFVVSERAQCVERMQDALDASQSMLPAFVLSVGIEHPELPVRSLDVDGLQGLLARVADELASAHREPEVAYRDGLRFVSRLVPLRDVAAAPAPRAPSVDVVFGGSGGIGLALAAHLSRHDAHVVLVGRRPVAALGRHEAERIEALIGASGHRVTYEAIDATSAAEVEALFDRLARDGRKPKRVFHLAGSYSEGPALTWDRAHAERLLAAKVRGSLVLHRACAAHGVGELVFFTSVNGILGGRNVALYAAANRFQEALQSGVQGHDRAPLVRSFAWSQWNGVGMSAGKDTRELLAFAGFRSLDPARALATLDELLRSPVRGAVVGIDVDAPRLRGVVEWPSAPVRLSRTSRATVPSPARQAPQRQEPQRQAPERAAPATGAEGADARELARVITEVWNEVLERDDTVEDDNVFDIGGTSLALERVAALLERRCGFRVRLADFFQSPRIADFAEMVAASSGASRRGQGTP